MTRIVELLHSGFGAALLPCSLVLLVPGLAAALAARKEAVPAVAGYSVAVSVLSWLLLSGRVAAPSAGLVALGFAASLFVLAMPFVRRLAVVSALGGALAGGAAATLWRPCPGAEPAQLIAELPVRGPSGAALLVVHLVGLLAPLFFVTAAMRLLPSAVLLPVRPLMLVVGGAALGFAALVVAVGLHDGLLDQLATWSL